MTKTYFATDGFSNDGTVFVEQDLPGWREVEVRKLPLCLDVRNHSPTGFAWGYGGSGPAQLALAILFDLVGRERAIHAYMSFKWAVISKLDQRKGWELSDHDVLTWLANFESGAAHHAR